MSLRLWPRSGLLAATLALGCAAAAHAEPVTVTFLHSNDVYEIAPVDGQGGFAPFMTLLKQERARNPNSITTFGGDLLSPSLLSGLTKGEQMIELTDAIGIEVAVLGNHEFDFGPKLGEERAGAAAYPWLATNVRDKDGKPLPNTADVKVIESGGYKIGFFGLLTPETEHLSLTGPNVVFADPIATAEAASARLRQMGADLVVALTHEDLADDRALAAKVKGVDIVLGGHDHDPMTIYEGGKLIVKAGHDLHYLAAVDVALDRVKDKDGKDAIAWRPSWRYESTAGIAPDPAIQAIVAKWNEQLDKELSKPVGETSVELDTRRAVVRSQESNFGDLVADALRAATGAHVAIANGGNIRGDKTYPAGTVLTRKDIQTELPFGNVTVLLELKGSDLREALENGVSQVEKGAGRFPQVSGMAFVWNPTKPVGQRVLEVKVGDAPLDPDATYRLATNEYLAAGGDGYASLTRGKTIVDASGGTLMANTVMNYITALGGKVAPKVEGRITRVP